MLEELVRTALDDAGCEEGAMTGHLPVGRKQKNRVGEREKP